MGNETGRTNEGTERRETTKEGQKYRNQSERKDTKNINANKSDNTTERNKSKDIGKRRKTQKVTGQGSNNKSKTEHSKITKENSTKMVESLQGQINNQIQKKKKKLFWSKIRKRKEQNKNVESTNNKKRIRRT